jgi:hypothetical protein
MVGLVVTLCIPSGAQSGGLPGGTSDLTFALAQHTGRFAVDVQPQGAPTSPAQYSYRAIYPGTLDHRQRALITVTFDQAGQGIQGTSNASVEFQDLDPATGQMVKRYFHWIGPGESYTVYCYSLGIASQVEAVSGTYVITMNIAD